MRPDPWLEPTRYGRQLLDLDTGELLDAGGAPVAGLRRQALQLLLLLGRRAGQVVGKDELMDGLRPRVVVGEGSLTQAVAEVWRALGDRGHRVLRNVARRGYMPVPDTPARAVLAAHQARHPLSDAARLAQRLPGANARLVDAQARLLSSLRAIAAGSGAGGTDGGDSAA